jgi:hypothetical protein
VVSTTSTILEQRTGNESAVEGWHLLVMTPALCASHPLPGNGALSIGETNRVFERLRTLPTYICATIRAFTHGASRVSLAVFGF